jgi:hypothetical protein
MTAIFQDLQQPENPLNGRQVNSAISIAEICRGLSKRKPFLFELRGDNGFMLTVGFAGNIGSVQYSRCDGLPPYLMAVSSEVIEAGESVDFLAGNTPTPIPRRFCLAFDLVERIASEFVEHGKKSAVVSWEDV